MNHTDISGNSFKETLATKKYLILFIDHEENGPASENIKRSFEANKFLLVQISLLGTM